MEYTKKEAKAYCKEHMTGVWAALTTPYTRRREKWTRKDSGRSSENLHRRPPYRRVFLQRVDG